MMHKLGSIAMFLALSGSTVWGQDAPVNKMTITRNDDSAWYIKVKAGYADQESAWIDWNNNGVNDGEDEMIDFYAYAVSHDVTSRTITIYGKITDLSLPYNKVEQLDVTQNPTLKKLFVNNNLLKELDLSGNPQLQQLYCYNNTIEKLDLSHNPQLYRVACYTNHIQGDNMWNLVNSIPSRTGEEKSGKIHITNSVLLDISLNLENLCTEKQVAVLKEKNWGVYDWKDGENEGENSYDGAPDIEEDNYSTDSPHIRLTASDYTGKWRFFYDVPEDFRNKCWIDLNGNQQYEEGEELSLFNTNIEIERTSNVLYLYGNFSTFICSDNNLSAFDINQQMDSLTTLNVEANALQKLDLRFCPHLESLNCDNNQLNVLNLSNLDLLKEVYCQFNEMDTLLLNGCIALKVLNCSDNQLKDLSVQAAADLDELYCSSNQLTQLDLSQNTALRSLYCNSQYLSSLDLSANVKLEVLYCLNNQLSALTVSQLPALRVLNAGLNQLENLNLDANTELTKLYVFGNKLSELQLKDKTFLSDVDCSENQLATFNIEGTPGIVNLYIQQNQLTTFDWNNLSQLQVLCINDNQLSELSTQGMSNLRGIRCEHNQLTNLDFRQNTLLTNATIYSNQIVKKQMSEVINSLPIVTEGNSGEITVIDSQDTGELNRCLDTDVALALQKSWMVKDNNGDTPKDYAGESETSIQMVNGTDLKLYPNPTIDYVDVQGLSEGDVVALYTMEGTLLLKKVADGETVRIDVSIYQSGNYLIQAGKRTCKLIVL